MKFNSSLLVSLSFGVSALAYTPVYDLQKRTCSKNNLYRTLERLQRESAFCEALLVPNPTVTVPSSIAATPIATISSACNCIVATLTTSSTTTSTTTSSVSVCANTITITPNPVTVTKTLDPVTVTETYAYTTTSTPTQAATSYSIGFEEPDRLWGCSTKSIQVDRFADFIGCGEHEDPARAHSGNWFYRASFYAGQTEHIIRFGNKKALPILPGVDYEFSLWYRQFGHNKSICTVAVDAGNEGLPNIATPETVNTGFVIFISEATTGLTWTKSSKIFNTRYTQIGFFIAVTCKCPAGDQCGSISVGFDDITLKPVVPV
ncbi:hypothetical protein TWF730_000927 [Orbilia blumenaviensis]|uniref:Uncharacterized protein n=1 Tax=Orbilia blumenaviensis TaxID=1796055 RepID=A0AAV9VQ40_9PEZI